MENPFDSPISRSRSYSLHSIQTPLPNPAAGFQFNLPESSGPKSRIPSGTPSIRASRSAFHVPVVRTEKYFRSRRIKDLSTISKPWLEEKDATLKWHTIFPLLGTLLGLVLAGIAIWQGYTSVVQHEYCLVYEDDFSSGVLNEDIWTKEVELGGFGNGEFGMTTNTDENVFIKDGQLWLKPTLQDEKLINQNSIIDLTKEGICTSDKFSACYAVTNVTNGTIVPPVKSARINTKKGVTIKYGRVEVVAKLPKGDWLWPAIWLLPADNKYGSWPASGEIDIAESRGNNHTYGEGGNDVVNSALHWGPSPALDAWHRTYAKENALHSTFSKEFHTFGLEWSEKYIFTYIDSRPFQVLYIPFDGPRWPQGRFDVSTENGTMIVDPWSQTGRFSTPFDEPFYLILNVAVGSTNGWWTDGLQGKPWVDSSPTAKKDFWDSRDEWYPTWAQDGQMQIKSVKMWQQAGHQGCKTG